jgi:CDP-glycerol glycerophosphotransferase (TagB/SpsB family)
LDHGIPFKQGGYDIDSNNTYAEKHDKIVKRHIDYYTTATSYVCSKMIMHSYHVDQNHTILCGKPRDDLFFDEKLRTGKNDIVEKIKSGRKAIIYMPTHRDCGKKPLHLSEILDLDYLDKMCSEKNSVFIVKKHFYHSKENENLNKYKNIYDITNENIETQMLLYQADILVSDYSSLCAEYLLLDRPLVLYTFDLDHYLEHERGLFLPMDKVDTGYKVMTPSQLNDCLTSLLKGEDDRFEVNRKKAKEIYFEPSIDFTNSRKYVTEIITQMINKQYNFSWQQYIDEAMSDINKKEIVTYVGKH